MRFHRTPPTAEGEYVMQLYELINYLNRVAKAHGDLPVYIRPCHTEYPITKDMFNVERAVLSTSANQTFDDRPKRLQIEVY